MYTMHMSYVIMMSWLVIVEIDKHLDKEEAPPTKEFAVVGLTSLH